MMNIVFKKIYCLTNGEDTGYFTNKSCIDDESYIKSDSYIEYSTIKDCIIGEKCIISNSNLKNVIIPDGVCIVTLKLENKKYISLIYGIEDNPKEEIDGNTKFLNTVLEKSIEKYDIDKTCIFDKNAKDIWNAKFYKMQKNKEDSVKSSLQLYDIIHCKATKKEVKEYFKEERISISDSIDLGINEEKI